MHFHVASRGVAINFGFPAGGSCFNCPYKIIKIFPRLLSFNKLNSFIRPLNFSVFKSYSVLVVLLLQLLSC